jgi:hypothetical protein
MNTEFCNRYRERNVPNPREMLALRDTPVDLSKWQPISFGKTPETKVELLAERGFVMLELTRSPIGTRRLSKGLGDRSSEESSPQIS